MKPHPKIRKVVKWTFTVMTVLLIAAWIGSRWYVCGWLGKGAAISFAQGRLGYMNFGEEVVRNGGEGWLLGRASGVDTGFRWRLEYNSQMRRPGIIVRVLHVPAWVLVLLSVVPVVLLWRIDLRERSLSGENCIHCRFSLVGLPPDAKCPECGKPGTRKSPGPIPS